METEFLEGLTEEQANALLYEWEYWARPEQLAPVGDWGTWLVMAGRGFGKTRTGAEWIRDQIENHGAGRVALVAPTAADARDVMVEGESDLLSIFPKNKRPKYEPSKRRLTWPNGATGTTYSADEPERLRGPQHDRAWCDEIGSWRYPQAWSNLMLGLRIGDSPKVCVTATPRPTPLVREILKDRSTVKTGGSTYDNRANLAASFFDRTVAKYEGTRLGLQEIHAVLLEISEGAWFPSFSEEKHVSPLAEYDPTLPVMIAIDCGTSRHTGAVYLQCKQIAPYRHRVTCFADYYAVDLFSEPNAQAIHRGAGEHCGGQIHKVRLDPAATQKTGVGPAARGEYEKVFGARRVEFWPIHRVADGLDQIEVLMGGENRESDLLIHPRCVNLIAAFKNYERDSTPQGEWLTVPKDPQHPAEELMDSLRGGVRDLFPEGRKPQPQHQRTSARRIF